MTVESYIDARLRELVARHNGSLEQARPEDAARSTSAPAPGWRPQGASRPAAGAVVTRQAIPSVRPVRRTDGIYIWRTA